jgi:hypothetical protein
VKDDDAGPVRGGLRSHALAAARALALALSCEGALLAQEPPQPVPSFAELEAAGARVGKIRVLARDIFDTDDPKENYLLFRLANALHIQTRSEVIERGLLFKTGDPVSVRVLEETERLLRNNRYLYDVQFRPVAYHDGVVDIEVTTRDTWTLDLGVSLGRAGGANSGSVQIKEYNLLGTGTSMSLGHSSDVDRTSNVFQIANSRAFGTWTALGYSHASNSDGSRDAASIIRPFYELDSRWAAGISGSRDDRIDSVYNAGEIASEYRHRQNQGEAFGGWSAGLSNGWVQRFSAGMTYLDDVYTREPGRVAPSPFPADEKLAGPFVRYELIEEHYEREQNRNVMGRPEFFALGLASTVQLGWASSKLGSTQDTLLYSASVSRGFEPLPDHTLTARSAISGQYFGGKVYRQDFGALAQYYLPQTSNWLLYGAAGGDMLTNPSPADTLYLGGDNGLRGYPLRYQSGTRRALFTVEERYFSDLYLWRLFRFGAVAFYDVGRAWGGDNTNALNPGWIGDVGVGLRIVSVRSALSNVLHVDVAMPLNATPDIKNVQLLVSAKTSF